MAKSSVCLAWQSLSWVAIVLGGSCPGGYTAALEPLQTLRAIVVFTQPIKKTNVSFQITIHCNFAKQRTNTYTTLRRAEFIRNS